MTNEFEEIVYDDNGLIPAIVQDNQTGKVLMLAYMDEKALSLTIETRETWFYSRSREELWNKGATSGNRQTVKDIAFDCDLDAVLVQVKPQGPACHTGEESCFYNNTVKDKEANREIVHELVKEISHRKENPVEGSYTSYLFREGIDKVLKKVGEESSEVIIGAKNEDKEELTSELADLAYHTLVLMEIAGVELSDVKTELLKRSLESDEKQDE